MANIAAMPEFDPQQAAVWVPFAGAIVLLLALRLAARRRRRRQASAPERRAATPQARNRARLIFLLALAVLTLILTTAIGRLLR